MDESYENKEAARAILISALESYKTAAEAFGLDESDMAGELEDALSEVGLGSLEVTA